jgi:hypothetical protein
LPGSAPAPADAAPWFLQGGGIAGATARAVPWQETPLGAPDSWPSTLKATLATIFHARQPMFLWWGRDLIQFYNDAYLPSFGRGKHPRAMAELGRECWREIWPIIGPQIEDVMKRGIASCLIALTGYGQEHDRRRSLDAGFYEHLVKPVDVDRLVRLVEAVRTAPPLSNDA